MTRTLRGARRPLPEAALSSTRLLAPDPAGIGAAARALDAGRLVGLPTETVYGLAADAFDPAAIARVFEVKGRPADNPVIVHVAAPDELDRVAVGITPVAAALAARFLPGPLTLVLDARPEVPTITTGGLSTVAVRVPDHPVATAVLERSRHPVAAPSANRSGRPSPTTAEHVLTDLAGDVDLVLDGGPCPVGVESTVVDARGDEPVVLREGSITREQLGLDPASAPAEAALAASPGTRYRHYAPDCLVELVPAELVLVRARELRDAGGRVGVVSSAPAPDGVVEVARFTGTVQLAQRLYAAFRDAEDAGVEVLLVEQVPAAGLGRAVMDRVQRAADAAVV